MHKSTARKLLLITAVVVCAVFLSGCRVPTDESGAIKQITLETTFQETMDSENWFSAIFVWPFAQMINHLTPHVGVVLAITLVTLLVNSVLLALTLKSQIGMQKMQLLQPELERIQRKYEGRDDEASRMKMAQEVQRLYSKNGVNPTSMMLIQFLQFPVIIAMYQAVQRASSVSSAMVGNMSLEVTILNGIRGGTGRWGYILLFVIMAAAQYVSMSLPQWINKKKAKEEADKHHRAVQQPTSSSQNKIMQYYMFALILVFGLMWPAAMSVYWTIYSLINIAKTLVVQHAIEKSMAKEGVKR
jgi:YidC/Oxa1 family membrane protein insertase